MNLKKSKFFKRFQKLRGIFRKKYFVDNNDVKKVKSKANDELQHDFKESSGGFVRREQSRKLNKKLKEKQSFRMSLEPKIFDLRLINCVSDEKTPEMNSLIQLNSINYRLKYTHQNNKIEITYGGPTIRSTNGSICVSQSRYGINGKTFKMLSFKVVQESKLWHILITDAQPTLGLYKTMKGFPKINNFPGMVEICCKDLLSRNLSQISKLFPRAYKIFPKTCVFPADLGDCVNFASKQGCSICLTITIEFVNSTVRINFQVFFIKIDYTVQQRKKRLCQEISVSFFIDGYTFDLRVYVLFTLVDPIPIFVYNEGLARFATSKYVEPTSNNNTDLFMHLTNYSENKRSSQYELCDNDDCGSKQKLSAINNWMRRHGHNVEEFWRKIDDIIIKTVLSAWPVLKHNYHACFPQHDKIQACFEILGFDIIVDSKLRPYILEVNHSPSFHTNEQVERQVKRPLIRDTLKLVSTALADEPQHLQEDLKSLWQQLLTQMKHAEIYNISLISNYRNMNLKNSKFFKRIQKLRRISKEKYYVDPKDDKTTSNKVNDELQHVFRERSGGFERTEQSKKLNKKFKEENSSRISLKPKIVDLRPANGAGDEKEPEVNSLIQLNNIYFRLKCPHQNDEVERKDDGPTISSTNGSICVSQSRYAMIGKISKMLGFKVVKESKLWNILWTDSLPALELYKTMKRFQQINHFPGMMEICRKDLLSRNLNRMLKLFPRDYKIFPKTWVFPADLGDCINFASKQSKSRFFIIKPDSGAQGRGIWLTNDIKSINPTERMICQAYINKPLLIDGYKFDLRVYVLITSVDPLRIFVYNEGLARFATSKYVEPTSNNNTDLFMHLTNYSVNKRSSQYELCDNDDCGSKRKLSAINNWMHRHGHNVEEFWRKIDDIIIKTVLSAWPVLKHNYHACFPQHDKIQACFEILGFDIIVDSKLRPYILEVNHSPSFHTNEQVDRQVKRPLIRDTLKLVSTALADKKQILREDRKRVRQRLLTRMKQGELTSRSHMSPSGNGQQALPQQQQGTSTPGKVDSDEVQAPNQCPLSPLTQQIAWEESHLGNFRRIMPPLDQSKISYYCQFYAIQNQASIYAETASSKKREENAKKLRMKLEEKRIRESNIIKNGSHIKFEERRRRRATLPRHILEKQRIARNKSMENWTPDFISDAEERLRRSWLQMRTEQLKSLKIVQILYQSLYNAGVLTNSDIVTYPQLYQSLESGRDVLNDANF